MHATTSDGLRLAIARFAPAGTPRAVALCAHAMMAGKAYQRGLAQALADEGILAYTFDFRGHGESDRPARGWAFWELVERDLPAVVAAVARDAGCAASELGYLGHSLGGLVGVGAFGAGRAPEPRKLALVSATPWTRTGAGRALRLGVAGLLAAAAWPLGRLPVRELRLGTDDEAARYLADFAGWVRRASWPWLDGAGRLRAPALVVVGERDLFCRPADARTIADRLGGPVSWLHAPGGHFGLFKARELWPFIAEFMGT